MRTVYSIFMALLISACFLQASYLEKNEIQVIGIPEFTQIKINEQVPAASDDVRAVGGCNFVHPTKDLVAYYPMDEDDEGPVPDESGNSLTALNSDAAWSLDGAVGAAFSFNGESTIALNQAVETINLAGPITISLWVKPAASEEGTPGTMVSLVSSAGQVSFSCGHGETLKLISRIYADAENVGEITTPIQQVPEKEWHHAVLMVEDGNLNVWLDGLPVHEAEVPRLSGVLSGLTLGQGFEGLLDEVRVYTRILDRAEIQQLYKLPGMQPKVTFDETGPVRDDDYAVTTRTWTGTDACGNTSQETQTIFQRLVPKNVIGFPSDEVGF